MCIRDRDWEVRMINIKNIYVIKTNTEFSKNIILNSFGAWNFWLVSRVMIYDTNNSIIMIISTGSATLIIDIFHPFSNWDWILITIQILLTTIQIWYTNNEKRHYFSFPFLGEKCLSTMSIIKNVVSGIT